MIKYYYPIPLIANFLLQLQWYLLMNHTYPRRFSKTVTLAAEVGIFAIHIFLGSMLPYMSWIRIFYVPVLFTVGFVVLYRERWQKIALTVMLLWLSMFVTEFLCALFVYAPEELAGHFNVQPAMRQIQIYVVSLPVSAVMVWFLYLLLNRAKNRLSLKQWLLCAVFVFSQMIILFGYMRELSLGAQKYQAAYVTFVLLSCAVMDAFLVQYVLSSARKEQLQKENQLLSAQIDEQLSRYTSITAEYEAIRHMRHDIVKHLNTMEALLKNGKNREAERYISELKSGSYRPLSTQFCENPAVDALLNSYCERTAGIGPRLEIMTRIPARLGIKNTDLVCAFGNLLDNAMEACSANNRAVISLRAAFARGCLLVSVDNPIESFGERQRQIPELERGVGTRILNHLAQEYRGAYVTSLNESGFHAQLTLMATEDTHDAYCNL